MFPGADKRLTFYNSVSDYSWFTAQWKNEFSQSQEYGAQRNETLR
jgi:hypothetical protein